MQLKITTDYAIRTLVYLAKNRGRIAPSVEIADAMKIPRKYLVYIGGVLRDAGLLSTHPGKYGGYSLGRPAEEITLFGVVSVMEGTVKINRCLEEDEYCSRDAVLYCPVCKSYRVMQRKWENFLCGITIADLLENLSEDEIEKRIDGQKKSTD